MSSRVSWSLQMSVRAGQLESAKGLIAEMVEATKSESGTLTYEWFLSDSGDACHILEQYEDDGAVVTHLANFGPFAERFMACFEIRSFSVYGPVGEATKKGLGSLGAVFHDAAGGFRR